MIRELLANEHGLLVQGITGRQGQIETRWMLESGVQVTAGVTPGRSGESVHGVPVYPTVEAAVSNHGNLVSMIYAPPAAAAEAAMEAVAAGVRLVVISAERVPIHGLVRAIALAKHRGARIVGPNSQGIVVPGVSRVGCPGGKDPDSRFRPGPVAVVSRSGGMASEISMLLRQWGLGTSVQLHIGGAPLVGTTLVEAVQMAQADPKTELTVVFGEPSSQLEVHLAEEIDRGRIKLPVIALIAGRFADLLPASLPFGHAPRAGVGHAMTVAEKVRKLEAAGVETVESLAELRATVIRLIGTLSE